MLEILVRRQEGVEAARGQFQQFSVPRPRPTDCGYCTDIVARQRPGQRARQRFIEEDAHQRLADPLRVQGRRPPVRDARWETRRETYPAGLRRPGSREDSSLAHGFRRRPACPPESRGRCGRRSPVLPCRESYTRTRAVQTAFPLGKCLTSPTRRRLNGGPDAGS